MPLNRFLCWFGAYLIYLCLVVMATLRPLSLDTNSTDFQWYHGALILYSGNTLYFYFLIFKDLQFDSSFFNIWRFFSLMMHLSVISSILVNVSVNLTFPCEENLEKVVYFCPPEYLHVRRLLSGFSILLFSTAVAGAVMRINYYLQMQSKLGPLIISISEVYFDVGTMVLQFILLVFASGFTFIVITYSDFYLSEDIPESNRSEIIAAILESGDVDSGDYDASFFDAFLNMLATLFWSVLDPGPYLDPTSGGFSHDTR